MVVPSVTVRVHGPSLLMSVSSVAASLRPMEPVVPDPVPRAGYKSLEKWSFADSILT